MRLNPLPLPARDPGPNAQQTTLENKHVPSGEREKKDPIDTFETHIAVHYILYIRIYG